jgi:hypothetical protein
MQPKDGQLIDLLGKEGKNKIKIYDLKIRFAAKCTRVLP